MSLSEHKLLFSLVVLASFVSLGWVLIIYVLSFHAAQWLVEEIDDGYMPRRRELRLRHSRPIPLDQVRTLLADG